MSIFTCAVVAPLAIRTILPSKAQSQPACLDRFQPSRLVACPPPLLSARLRNVGWNIAARRAYIHLLTQVPGGDAGSFRFTLVAIAMRAPLASVLMARYANRRLDIE